MKRLAVAAALLLCGCGTSDRDLSDRHLDGWIENDSAGVAIVTGSWEAIEALPQLRLGETRPLFGYDETAPDRVLQRVQGVIRHAGRVVIGDSGFQHLVVIGDGVPPQVIGGAGSGPGEFRNLNAIFPWSGDSVLVFDASWPRVTVVSLAGGPPRTFGLPSPEGTYAPLLRGGIPGEGLVVEGFVTPLDRVPTEPYWQRSQVWITGEDGARPVRLADQRGLVLAPFLLPSGGETVVRVWPHSPQGVTVSGGGRVFASEGDRFSLHRLSPDGVRERGFRLEAPPRALSDAVLRAEARELSGEEVTEAQIGRHLELSRERGVPDTLPEIRRMLVDDRGYLWVERYRAPGDPEAEWVLFDEALVPVSRLRVPRQVSLFDAHEGVAYGVWVDALGRQIVQAASIDESE